MRETKELFDMDFENLSPPRQVVYEAVIQSESFGVDEPPSGVEHTVVSCTPILVDLWFTDWCMLTEVGENAKKWAPTIDDETILRKALLV